MAPANGATNGAAPGPEAQFRALLQEGRLCLQHCAGCARWVHYPRVVCPYCACTRLEFREVPPEGTVYSTTVEHRHAATDGRFNLALVDLDAGVRIFASVVGCEPEAVHIGQRVRATIGIRQQVPVILFEPLGAGA